jgi:hypothetical protein
MTEKEKLYYLIREYSKGDYDTKVFCDEFSNIYNIETDYTILSEDERQYFSNLCEITDRFSEYEDELAIPNMYFSEADVRNAVEKVMVALSI